MAVREADIVIKGSKDGLTLFLDAQCDFSILVKALETKLASADSFLVGAHVIADIGARELTEEQRALLRNLFPSYGLILKEIVSWQESEREPSVARLKGNRERIYQIANNLYGSGEKEAEDGSAKGEIDKRISRSVLPESTSELQTGTGPAATKHDSAAAIEGNSRFEVQSPSFSYEGDEQTLLIQRTVRSGQKIRYPGHVVILGDVNPGAEVIAGGHIVVMGSFRGVAHAGAYGNKNAIVTAFRLRPTQLRIADHITRPPDEDSEPPEHPEIAMIKDNLVTIERYQFSTKNF